MASGNGLYLWVWLVASSGCGCKKVYKFPHVILIPTRSPLVYAFLAVASLLYVHL